MMRAIACGFLGLLLCGQAFAQDAYDATNGFAASGYDVVAYWSLERVAPNAAPPAPVPGRESLTVEHLGTVYAFSSEENRAAFVEDPERYLPEYGGHCAFGVSRGVKPAGNPTLWRIDDGRLYFNGTEVVYDLFREDIPGNLSLADANWPALELEPAALNVLQDFDPLSAPLSD